MIIGDDVHVFLPLIGSVLAELEGLRIRLVQPHPQGDWLSADDGRLFGSPIRLPARRRLFRDLLVQGAVF